MNKTIKIGTRGSKLALYQAYKVKEELKKAYSELSFEIVIIKTKGDKVLDVALSKIGDKGLFTKELEIALFEGEIDMAVHSLKDLPTTFPEGAQLGAILKRAEERDCLVSKTGLRLHELTESHVIATSSLRRKAQLLKLNPKLKIVDIRGNVNTRIRKMQEGYCDAMVMASAGLQRLDMDEHITEILDETTMIPACGQGAIAVEIRDKDTETLKLLQAIHHEDSHIRTNTERTFLKRLEGGCQVPVGAHSELKGENITVTGFVSSIDGSQFLRNSKTGKKEDGERMAEELAKELFELGGKEILEEIRKHESVQQLGNSLQGKRFISTRPSVTGDSLPSLLTEKGAQCLSFPMIEIQTRNLENEQLNLLNALNDFTWLFFTSKNGVVHFFKQYSDYFNHTDLPKQIKIASVGEKTAAELEYYGYKADFLSTGNTGEEMLNEWMEIYSEKERVLLILGNLADDKLESALSEKHKVARINVYNTIRPESYKNDVAQLIIDDEYDAILFTSPSTFNNFKYFLKDKIQLSKLKAVSIGKVTTSCLKESGVEPILTAERSTVEGMLDSLEKLYK